jgi:hypothetical protein
VTEVVPARDGHEGDALDGIDALRVLRADTPEEKTKLLEQIAGTGKVEQDIVSELSKVRPLWKPDEFEAAHRMAMRSLEVLDRNGARQARLPRLGPLRPIASWLVQLVTRWIVRNHQNGLVTAIRKLYEKREANAAWDTPEHHALRRARIDVTRLEQGLKANPIGLPKVLLGGAFLSGVISGMSRLVLSLLENQYAVLGVAAVIVGVLACLAWVALFSAAVARRRINLSTDQPVNALWATIGAAGKPPRDESFNFALYAIALLILASIIVPIAIGLVIRAA